MPLMLGALTAAHGQLVTPKTVPVHQDDQFAIFPSRRAGMADASIALDDTLADPFVNPAKATSVRVGSVFTTPFTHNISRGAGGGNTLPMGALGTRGEWSGGAIVAMQSLRRIPGSATADGGNASNQYAALVVARRLPGGVSIGGSAYIATLDALDGIDLLYGGSDHIIQTGLLGDVRLGIVKSWRDQRLEAVLVNNRTNMTHDVHYPSRMNFFTNVATPERSEHNVDQTNIWGIHTQFVQKLGLEGWHLGWVGTADRLSHPKIPDYQVQNIPRDPGTTYGFNVGVGLGRAFGSTSFGIDVIQEPMFSDTWATAGGDTATAAGGMLHAGERTVDNHFKFANSKVRIGIEHEFAMSPDSSGAFGVQLGLGEYSINYRLRQTNHVQGTERVLDEGWTEWTPTAGLYWRGRNFEIRYNYSRTCGPDACIDFGMGDKVTITAPAPSIIAAPSSPLAVNGGTTHMHRLMLSVPIR